jgi:hypothetical protein
MAWLICWVIHLVAASTIRWHGAMIYAMASGLDIYLETLEMQLPSHKINQWHAYEIHQQACEALISKYSKMF